MKKNTLNYLLALVCMVGLTANADELTQTNANDSVKVNVTAGASAITALEYATETDTFTYGGQLGLSFENVLVDNLEVGIRQSLSSYDTVSSYDITTTTTTTGPDQVVTTTTTTQTTDREHVPKGNAWGWWKKFGKTTTVTTTEVIPGETTTVTETTTVANKSSEWLGNTELFVDYNVPVCDTLTLFIGANASLYYGDGITPSWYAGPEGGLKVNLNEDVYLYGRVNYEVQLNDRHGDDGDQLRYNVGVGVRF